MTQVINQEISVSSFYFTGSRGLKTFPRQAEFDGNLVTFTQNGLRYLVRRGNHIVRLFDMPTSDGATYRLRQESGHWTLVGKS